MTIKITDDMRKFVKDAADNIIEEKLKEQQYINDKGNLKKRFINGLLGECAVYISLGYNYDDVETDTGNTKEFNHSDLTNIGIFNSGIKTVENGKYPIIYKNNKENQIFCIINDDTIEIAGIGTIDILNDPNNQDDNMILSPKLRAKGFKTAFTALDKLINFDEKVVYGLE